MSLSAYSTDATPGFTGLDWEALINDGTARRHAIYYLNDSTVLGDGKLRVTVDWSCTMHAIAGGGPFNAGIRLYALASDDDATATPCFQQESVEVKIIPNHVFAPNETLSNSGTTILTTQNSEFYPCPAYFDIRAYNTLANTEYTDFNLHISLIEWVPDVGDPVPIYPDAFTADFSGTPLSGPAPLTVAFTDATSDTPNSWAWTFGNGDISGFQNPSSVYPTPGTYTVALTASNGTDTDTETKVDYITVLGAPVVDFVGVPTSGYVALSVDFTDLSTNSPDTWFWDFGDGTSSTSQNPTHVYNFIGTYTVTLTASSTAGSDFETKVDYITVLAISEYGAATIENCDVDTGGAAVGLRVADVAIARDNRFGSVVIDAASQLNIKDSAYSTLTNNGVLNPYAGDRAVFDTATYFDRHASDIEDTTFTYHVDPDNPPLSSNLASGQFYVGNGSNVATAVSMSGDATLANDGELTISAGAVVDSNVVMADATIFIGGVDGAAHGQTISGDASLANSGALTVVGLQGNDVANTAPTDTQVLMWNAGANQWEPADATGGSGGIPQVYNEIQFADGTSSTYYLINSASPGTIRVYKNGIRLPATDDIAPTDLVVFDSAPELGAVLVFDYEMELV